MSRRLLISGGSRPLDLVLVDTLVVGRDPACDISEHNDPLMSRRHAAFTADARQARVKDLGSRNGILVNGAKRGEAELRHGDVVQIGHLQVKYVEEVGPFLDMPFDPAPGSPRSEGLAQGRPADDAATRIADSAETVMLDDRSNGTTRKL